MNACGGHAGDRLVARHARDAEEDDDIIESSDDEAVVETAPAQGCAGGAVQELASWADGDSVEHKLLAELRAYKGDCRIRSHS